MSGKKEKAVTIGDIGFAMKYEASVREGDTVTVSKELWHQIADILLDADRCLRNIERETNYLLKGCVKNG